MKRNIKRIFAVTLVCSLFFGSVTVSAMEETSSGTEMAAGVQSESLVLQKENIDITQGEVADLSSESTTSSIMQLEEGTVIIKYKSISSNGIQSLFSVSNSTVGNPDRHFHIYVTPAGVLGMELRNTDSDFKYTMSAQGAVDSTRTNIIAFKMDSVEKNYKLFSNGELVSTLNKDAFKGFVDITGLDTISLGGTVREGNVRYPFGGTIENVEIYNTALSDSKIIEQTSFQIPTGLIMDKSNIQIIEGTGYDLSGEPEAEYIERLSKGTFIVSFHSTSNSQYQSLISVGNDTAGNQDRHFHLYVTNTGAVGMELRNTDAEFKYTLLRPAALTGTYKGEDVINTVAFKADNQTGEYKIFANGELLASLNQNDYKFISNITGVNNVMLGGTVRQGNVSYPFGGVIDNIKVYGSALSDSELLETTGQTTYGKNIFSAGDATGANYFRIPTLLTLESGTVVATADARYGGTHDAKSNIDIAFSKSTDNGETWSVPTLPLCFTDYAAQQVDWLRDDVGKNVQIQGSASFIDSVTVQDKESGRLFLFADAMPAGIGFSNTAAGSGFKTIKGEKYVKLRWYEDGNDTYNYTIRENGAIYNDSTNLPTEYSVDGDYNIMKNGAYLMQKQYLVHFEGTRLIEELTDVDVKQNVFYKDSCFKVLPTNFIVMKYSDDEGITWSDMKILGDFKDDNQRMPLYGPGIGTQIENGPYAGRMLISMYNSISAEFGFIYSDDQGNTWDYVTTDLGGSGTFAEAQIVELPDGTLQTYMRTSVGKIGVITSIDGGMTWTPQTFVPGMTAASYGTQLSVIKYSGLVDGEPAILLSAPNATNGRRGGKIWIGLITDTGQEGYDKYSVEWKYCYAVDRDVYGFAYSCMTELPNGDIGILYEKYDSWSRSELHLKNILKYESYSINELTGR